MSRPFAEDHDDALNGIVEEWNDPVHPHVSEGVSLDDFNAYMPMHSYIFTPSREMWPAASVNARIPPIAPTNRRPGTKPLSASAWLDKNKSVEQMTWAPGEPMLIPNRLISDGGWIDRKRRTCFNLYRPPAIEPGNAAEAGPWLAHADSVFSDQASHVIKWLAHRVQRPQEKINHALVLGGNQGIGKDTLLEPVKRAIGPWNFAEVSPTADDGPIQRLPKIRHLAGERSARPRRRRPISISEWYAFGLDKSRIEVW